MSIKTNLVLLVRDKKRQTEGIPKLQELFGYLIDELNALTDEELEELEEYNCSSESNSDVLRLAAWQSVPINVEFSERFIDEILTLSTCD